MKTVIAIATLLALLVSTLAFAGTSCTSRKSGSYTKTSCSSSHGGSSHCTSYMSGSVHKTYCR